MRRCCPIRLRLLGSIPIEPFSKCIKKEVSTSGGD
jgi:hypothetical protein